jgi:NAD+ synthetase
MLGRHWFIVVQKGSTMIVTLHQINTVVGDFRGNLDKILQGARAACENGATLAVFPELSLTGYPPLDLLENSSFINSSDVAFKQLLDDSSELPISILFGTILSRDTAAEGKPLSNAAVLIRDGKVEAVHTKVLLPTYDVFDESRHFHPGDALTFAEVEGTPLAISVCEDVWNDKTYWSSRHYNQDPVEEALAEKEGTVLVNIAASPYSHGKGHLRQEMLSSTARRYQSPILYVNQVGGNDSLVFDGRSLVMGPAGNIAALAKEFKEQILTVNLDDLPVDSTHVPHFAESSETLLKALSIGVRDYATKCGFSSAVLGLSGGIDSALCAVIACKALGADNVQGILMPSPFTSIESVEDAEALALNLGMPTDTIPITGIYRSYLAGLAENLGGLPGDTTEENIQARIRGNILMALSNRFGHLVLSTGNKSELAMGYCTLYGDMSGGLAVISDLYKGEVYELSRHINSSNEIIPERTLTKAPSAELRPDQKDSDSLPPYDLLDAVLKAYIEEHLTLEEIAARGYSRDEVTKILNTVEGNEYKRQQAAPGIKVSWKAFGIGRRCPIAKARLF